MNKSKSNGAARANGKAHGPNGHNRKPTAAPMTRSSDDPMTRSSDPITRSPDLAVAPLSREEAVRQAVETVIQATPEIARAVTAQARQGNYLPAKFLFDFVGITGAPAAPAEDQSLAALLLSRLGLASENAVSPEAGLLHPSASLAKESADEPRDQQVSNSNGTAAP